MLAIDNIVVRIAGREILSGATANLPAGGGLGGATSTSATGRQESTTNYEISKTTRTEVQEPGQVKRLSVAVAVDGATGDAAKDGKPGPYTPRTAEEMQRIEQLVRTAVGFNQQRGDQVTVRRHRTGQPPASPPPHP